MLGGKPTLNPTGYYRDSFFPFMAYCLLTPLPKRSLAAMCGVPTICASYKKECILLGHTCCHADGDETETNSGYDREYVDVLSAHERRV